MKAFKGKQENFNGIEVRVIIQIRRQENEEIESGVWLITLREKSKAVFLVMIFFLLALLYLSWSGF